MEVVLIVGAVIFVFLFVVGIFRSEPLDDDDMDLIIFITVLNDLDNK
ncbi:hypothetical protein ACNSOO_10125 [Aliarcobacter lanthieri]